MTRSISRRDFVYLAATAPMALGGGFPAGQRPVDLREQDKAVAAGLDWHQGDLVHLIPMANHQRFLIKTSFRERPPTTPALRVGERRIPGVQSDPAGSFWRFDVTGLSPDTVYELQLMDERGGSLCDPWPLRTFPHPAECVDHLRILTFTCGGGDEDLVQSDGVRLFIPVAHRQRLLKRGLAMKPDIVIANGDQIYWDHRTMTENKPPGVIETWKRMHAELGTLDPDLPIFGTENEAVIKRVGNRQIADLYGVSLRSTPTYMLTDDHDLFENDEATADYVTLPPHEHRLEAARATQHLYYPEFLPDPGRPTDLPGSGAGDRAPGLSAVFGSIRYGKLFEALLYDTKRYATVDGCDCGMIPPAVEDWLAERTAAEDTAHLVHVPSTPMGWSAGKWGEWYPDALQADGSLGVRDKKPFWPVGWWHQHQRILESLGAQERRVPVIMSGDLHMFSAGRIVGSGELDFSHNPVYSLVVGTLGTGTPAYASAARGVLPQAPAKMQVDEFVKPTEKNGFTIIDISPDEMSFAMYAWRSPDPVETIDRMLPFQRFVIPRRP